MGKIAGTAIVTAIMTAVITSAFWIWFYNFLPITQTEPAKTEARGPDSSVADVAIGPSGIAVPVAGIRPDQLVDTFKQARAGGARVHDAIDIMAAEGTPVVAAADGIVEKLFFSQGGGGISIYVRSPDQRWSYYYAHLQGYAPGLAEGQRVRRGQVIGRVGHTGNANPAGPHLHFAVNRMEPGWKWHQGAPVNPYPLLAGNRASG